MIARYHDFLILAHWSILSGFIFSLLCVNVNAIENQELENQSISEITKKNVSQELHEKNPIPTPKIKKIDFSDSEIQKILNEHHTLTVPVNRQALTSIAQKFVRSLQQHNISQFNQTLDHDAIVSKSLDGLMQLYDNETIERRYILRGINSIAGLLISKIGYRGHIKLIRIVQRQSDYRALIRIQSNRGELSYIELQADRDKHGQVKIVDYFDYMLGRNYTTVVNQLLVNIEDAKDYDKIAYLNSNRVSIKKQYTRSIRFYLKGQYKKALRAFLLLPANFRSTRNNLLLQVQISKLLSHNSYHEALTLLENAYSYHPDLGLLLADHYFFTKQYSFASNSLEKFERFIGGDIAVQTLRIKTTVSKKDYTEAILMARNAIAADNSYQEIYWVLLKVLLQTYQYQHVGGILDVLMNRFEVEFDIKSFYKDPFYREYGFSRQFKEWRASRRINTTASQVKTEISDSEDEQ